MDKSISVVVIAVIRHSNGKYLLTMRTDPDPEDEYNNIWQLPGGGLEFGETIEECIKREAREELGINISPVQMIPNVYEAIRSKTTWHGLLLCYLCKMDDEKDTIQLNHESSEYKWYTVPEITTLNSFPETKNVIALAEKINS